MAPSTSRCSTIGGSCQPPGRSSIIRAALRIPPQLLFLGILNVFIFTYFHFDPITPSHSAYSLPPLPSSFGSLRHPFSSPRSKNAADLSTTSRNEQLDTSLLASGSGHLDKLTCELCVLEPSHRLCRYGIDNVRLSRAYQGSGHRVRKVIEKALRGEVVEIAVLGASVSAGLGITQTEWANGAQRWQDWFLEDFKEMFPKTIMHQGALSGVGIHFFGFCASAVVPVTSDMFLLEVDLNNYDGASTYELDDVLMRSLLDLPQEPAVIRIQSICLNCDDLTRGATSTAVMSQWFDVPDISLRSGFLPHVMLHEELIPTVFGKVFETPETDIRHISYRVHQFLGDMLSLYIREQICETKRRLLVPSSHLPKDEVWPHPQDLGKVPRLAPWDGFYRSPRRDKVEAKCQVALSTLQPMAPDATTGDWHFDTWMHGMGWKSQQPGSSIEFTFRGTRAGIFVWLESGDPSTLTGGRLACWVVGQQTVPTMVEMYTQRGWDGSEFFMVADNLPMGNHRASPLIDSNDSIATKSNFGRATGRGGDVIKNTRNFVVVLDGTGNAFGPRITSLPTLFSFLSAQKDASLLYYLSGVGTHEPTWSPSGIVKKLARVIDSAIASSLGDQVKRAYQFLSDYYQPGDRIFIFGFSRGAFTARALVGMIQQVGLIFPGNEQSTSLAYDIYSAGADKPFVPDGEKLAAAFKRSFSQECHIHFVGVWDTVSSVGAIIPRTLPFSAGASQVSHFRQALALDERRIRFTPQPWMPDDCDPLATAGHGHTVQPTVKERWFAGAHSDVGGGAHDTDGDVGPSLSKLSLRWMIREAFEQGLPLDMDSLEASPIYSPFLTEASRRIAEKDKDLMDYMAHKNFDRNIDVATIALVYVASLPSQEATKDALAPRSDALSFAIDHKSGGGIMGAVGGLWSRFTQRIGTLGWWALEIIPNLRIVWRVDGLYRSCQWISNCGNPRQIPPDPVFHFSVQERISAAESAFSPCNGSNVPESDYKFHAVLAKGSKPSYDNGGWKDEGKI